ncbi:copper resistance CopC family protein [Nocardioides marmoraquaticus]
MHGTTALLAVGDGSCRRRPQYRRSAAVVACAAIITALMAFGAGSAQAHTSFLGSDPIDGARLATAPAEIDLEFSEVLQPELVVVNLRVAEGSPTRLVTDVEGGRLVARVPSEALQPAESSKVWRVDFRVVSQDGHPITGTSRFAVAPAPQTASDGTDPTATAGQTPPADRAQEPTPLESTDTPEQTPAGRVADSERGPAWLSTLVIGVITIVVVAGAITLISRGRTRPE